MVGGACIFDNSVNVCESRGVPVWVHGQVGEAEVWMGLAEGIFRGGILSWYEGGLVGWTERC